MAQEIQRECEEIDKGEGKDRRKNPDIRNFIVWWSQEFEKRFGEKAKIDGGKDGMLVEKLLKLYPLERLCNYAVKFLDSTDKFHDNKTIGTFYSGVTVWVVKQKNGVAKTGAEEALERLNQNKKWK